MRTQAAETHRLIFAPLPIRSLIILSLILFASAAPIQLRAQLPAGTRDAGSQLAQPDPLRTQANTALDNRDFPAALKLLTALAEKSPNDPHLLYDLASTQDALDQDSAAAQNYHQAIAADLKFFEPRLALALLLARQGKTKDAHAQLDIAITLEAPDPTLKSPRLPDPGPTRRPFRSGCRQRQPARRAQNLPRNP